MSFDHEKDFERELSKHTQPSPSEAFVESLANRLHAAHAGRAAREPAQSRWRLRVLPWTAGGIGVAVVMVSMMLWLSSDVGFAAVQKSLRNVRVAQFQARLVADHVDGWPDEFLTLHVWLDVDAGARSRAQIMGYPVLESFTRWDEDVWVVNHLRGQVTRWQHGQDVDRWVRELDPALLLQQLRDMRGIEAREVDVDMIDGKAARCYALSGRPLDLHPEAQLLMWVDVQTHLPIRIEFALPKTPQGRMRLIVDRFTWNKPMDADWFTPPNLPEVDSLDQLLPPVNVEAFCSTLEAFSDRTQGYYPGHPMAIPSMLSLMLQWQQNERGDTDSLGEHVQMLENMLAAGAFLVDLVRKGSQPAYYGYQVQAGDADAVLMQWVSPSGREHTLYGDLRHEVR